MAAQPLPLQLKSWKGCIAELVFARVPLVDIGTTVKSLTDLRRERDKYGTDQPAESTALGMRFAGSASSIAAAPCHVCRA